MLVAGQTPEENFRNLHAAGCIQTLYDLHEDVEKAMVRGYPEFCRLMFITSLNPCDGCPALSKCKAYDKYNQMAFSEPKDYTETTAERIKKATTANNGPFGEMSVKQIAKKFNISKNQVRRLKVQGKLETLLEKP